MKQAVILAWSGGKDSAFALYELQKDPTIEVKYLLTTLNSDFKRVSMHGVREELLDAQAESLGIPLLKVWIEDASYANYETQMEATLQIAKSEGILTVAFGDIFLEDIRSYREANLDKIGMKALFPLWNKNTLKLANEFIEKKFRTITCCTDDIILGETFLGKEFNSSFLAELPNDCDPCGENGEFHTFCFDGPIFKNPIAFELAERVFKPFPTTSEKVDDPHDNQLQAKGFWYQEIRPM